MNQARAESAGPVQLVRQSVGALLDGIVDYAGLFPPASLDMPTTVRNYAAYLRDDPDSWMLSRLVVPAARLDEFEAAARGVMPAEAEDDPWIISALVSGAGDAKLADEIARIERFNLDHADCRAGLALVDVIELKGDDAAAIDASLEAIPDELFPFYEIDWRSDPRGKIAALVGNDAGAKVRTGGVDPRNRALIPGVAELARFIAACAATDVPFKATAGLHHPMRHFSNAVGADEHGFLNVFIAAALANIKRIGEEEIREALAETDAAAFTFHEQEIIWRDQRLVLDEIEETRSFFAISFGSCSFTEPRDDLKGLGLV
jgi:hypothetical protein